MSIIEQTLVGWEEGDAAALRPHDRLLLWTRDSLKSLRLQVRENFYNIDILYRVRFVLQRDYVSICEGAEVAFSCEFPSAN